MEVGKKQLTEYLRAKLKVPIGKVLNENEVETVLIKKNLLITIGDTCSYNLITKNIRPDIIVYDFKNMRMPIEEKVKRGLENFCKEKVVVHNPAGHITKELIDAVKKAIERKKGCIFVDGEEDLAALVAMMHAPDNSYVLYGQPNEGIVVVNVNEEIRRLANSYYEQMEAV
ncbi:GTP-dependent dephospho-CoA kinase family protein [Candidatus Micrarchaeota archaeon]|nr:GTP-dependent dephospho-CoA kinase family protein [Candidatus Micrarchaeota archaeon]